jgi:glycogen phosphorylase
MCACVSGCALTGVRSEAVVARLRDVVIRRWIDTQLTFTRVDPKRVYYLSLEYLIGRTLQNAVLNLDMEKLYKRTLRVRVRVCVCVCV